MNQQEICSLCLGGSTDVPPFGTIQDARDLMHPCSTCSIVTHKKCLLDWFNSLPSDKLLVLLKEDVDQHIRTHDLEIGQPSNVHEIHLNLSPENISNMVAGFMNPSSSLFAFQNQSNTLVLAPCPQCKNDIVFGVHRSPLLTLNTGIRTVLSRGLQFLGLFLGITSAVTGVISMGYIGLTSCGLKMMYSMVPEPLLLSLLTKKTASENSVSILSSILSRSRDTNYSIDSLETALSRGLIDPFKFSRIPILPIVLYRMRQSSLLQCAVGTFQGKNIHMGNWLTEFMINGYISSLGNHQLVKAVYQNLLDAISSLIRNPLKFYKHFNLLKGVDLWDIHNMISMIIPARLLYELFHRFTINQLQFDIVMQVRPRAIANNLEELEFEDFEQLSVELNNLKQELIDHSVKDTHGDLILWIQSKVYMMKKLSKDRLWFKYLKLKLVLLMFKLKACLKNDYSEILSYKSFAIRCLTTFLWPFVSAELGKVVHPMLGKYVPAYVPRENVMFLANMISMALVVMAKDLANVYLNYKKLSQLSDIQIVHLDQVVDTSKVHREQVTGDDFSTSIPGGFQTDLDD